MRNFQIYISVPLNVNNRETERTIFHYICQRKHGTHMILFLLMFLRSFLIFIIVRKKKKFKVRTPVSNPYRKVATFLQLQSWPKYMRQTLVLMRNSALREKFNFNF